MASKSRDRPPGRQRERRYQQLFESSPLPLWVYDLQTLRFLDVNEVACRKYGYTREEFLAMTLLDIRPPEDAADVQASVRDTPTEVWNSGVWRHRLKSGEVIWVEITSHEMRFMGRATRFVCPIDVTQRLQAQRAAQELTEELERRVQVRTAQLEASNRELVAATRAAEQANLAKRDFLTRMSHELRTPLNAIIGFSHLLSSPEHGLTPERQALYNASIHQAGEHLLSLISELLNLAQIEAGKLRLDMQRLPLAEVLRECEAMVAPQAEAAGIALRNTGPAQALSVVADRTRLKQVLLNLLSNGVKYNRAHGELELRVAPGDGERVRLEVRDTGAGLRPDQLQQLFEPFNRLGRSGDGVEGTGLGLAVTRQLVELMGGRIGVDSTPGVGSTFWVELAGGPAPAEAHGEAPRRTAQRESAPGAQPQRTVLCVEDDAPSLELIRAQLGRRSDLRLITATNGREGVALALAHEPDVILMDNRMPELTGRQAVQLLAQDPRTAGIPVIAVSAGAADAGVEPLDVGLNWFRRVAKPFRQDDLLQAIDDAIRSRRGGASA